MGGYRPASADGSVAAHEGDDVGFFLVGARREELEQAIGYRPTFGTTLQPRLPADRLGWASSFRCSC